MYCFHQKAEKEVGKWRKNKIEQAKAYFPAAADAASSSLISGSFRTELTVLSAKVVVPAAALPALSENVSSFFNWISLGGTEAENKEIGSFILCFLTRSGRVLAFVAFLFSVVFKGFHYFHRSGSACGATHVIARGTVECIHHVVMHPTTSRRMNIPIRSAMRGS